MSDLNKSARLVICRNCGLHAHIEFRNGETSREFLATEAIVVVTDLTRSRKLSFAECGRFAVQIDDWLAGLSEEQWEKLQAYEEQVGMLQSLFGGGMGGFVVISVR